MECTDRILLCGYTGTVSIQRKEDVSFNVVLHGTVRLLPMLQQICSGMKLYGLLTLVQQETDICRQLFVPGSFTKVDADFLVETLSPVFSEKGTMRQGKNNIEDMPEEETKDENEEVDKAQRNISDTPINVARFCQWLTGQSHVPLSDADREKFKIVMEFDHECHVRYGTHSICYPVVNACSRSVTFPVAHLGTYAEFKNVISQAIVHGYEFGRC
uniref:HECT domain-containing protein n=1 Tax=Sinocyclocheilus grahami TaxID=75366 RepID=A0A672L1P8_SINGR